MPACLNVISVSSYRHAALEQATRLSFNQTCGHRTASGITSNFCPLEENNSSVPSTDEILCRIILILLHLNSH